MIKLQIIGNLGKDCTVNNVNGKTVMNFSVCHTEKYKDNNGVDNQRSVWADCSYWSDKTAIAQYLKKGTQVYIDGQPDVRVYTANGKTAASITLRVGQIQLLGSKKEEGGGNGTQNSNGGYFQQQGNATGNYVDPNDITEPISDLPF